MVRGCCLLMHVFVALYVLAHVPYESGVSWQLLQAPVVWVVLGGWALFMFPCPVARLLLVPLRALMLVLVWLGTLLVAVAKLVLVALNRLNRDLAGVARSAHL